MKKLFVCFVLCLLSFRSVLSASSTENVLASPSLTIGILSAIPKESGQILEHMKGTISSEKGQRVYHQGKLYGVNTVLVSSRIGKVAAAIAATHLILEYHVDLIIFTGVAGAVVPSLNVGDIVVANALMQHDMDARPFCPIYEIPLLKIKAFQPDPLLESLAVQAAQHFVDKELMEVVPQDILREFQITRPSVQTGLILTGDNVISQEKQKAKLRENLPLALCVEMEGASVSQVCYEYGIPYVIVRTISDYANHGGIPIDITRFVNQISGHYSTNIVKNIYSLILSGYRTKLE